MTYEELLQRVKDDFSFTYGLGNQIHYDICVASSCDCSTIDETHLKLKDAMLAVVALHKPEQRCYDATCYCADMCSKCKENYPCSSIQAIEKALV